MKTINIRFNRDFLQFKSGFVASVECDKEGTPTDQFYRNLLKDSEIDGVVSIVEPEPAKTIKQIKPAKIKKPLRNS